LHALLHTAERETARECRAATRAPPPAAHAARSSHPVRGRSRARTSARCADRRPPRCAGRSLPALMPYAPVPCAPAPRGRRRRRSSLDRAERVYYEPHVRLELAGLFDEIGAVAAVADRRALMIVFSALLVKFSRQRADTSDDLVQKRIRKGLVSEFFVRKGRE